MIKTFELVTFGESTHLKVTMESGKVWWATTSEENPYYAEYLRYTAWVEAGNDPDEFWEQEEI